MANIEKIVLPDNTEYEVHDANALPKTGGVNEPLTGDVYLENSGTILGRVHIGTSGCSFNASNAQGDYKAGLYADVSGQATIYADSSNIVFRPNGSASSTNQVYLDTNGQFNGGVKSGSYTKNTQTNMNAGGNWTTIITASGLVSSGIYIATIHMQYNPNSTTAHSLWMRVNGVNYESLYASGNSIVHIDDTRIVTGVTEIKVELVPQNTSITSANVSAGCFINYYRIA